MRFRGLGRVSVWRDRLRNRLSPGSIILLYHRIANLPSDPQLLCVSPENFAEQLDVVRRISNAVSLQAMQSGLRNRQVPKRGVVITFDDGTADNLYAAKPVLNRHDIPATFFVSTGYMKTGREYWWDELERLLIQSKDLPEGLKITISGKVFEWNLDADIPADGRPQTDHKETTSRIPTARDLLYRRLIELLIRLDANERVDALDELRAWAKDAIFARDTHRPLNCDEVRKLAGGGLEVGAHTVSHSMLSALPAELQRSEIQNSKTDLETLLGHRVDSFAYPFGTLSDYTKDTVKIVRACGFQYACSNFSGVVLPGSDPFQLPRMIVRNWSGDEFEERLHHWFRKPI